MQSAVSRAPRPSGLADVVELILDKGLVIDAFVRVSVVGIELLTIDARIVVASVDTYLRFAEAVNRLDLNEVSGGMQLQDLGGGGLKDEARHGAASGALEEGKEKASELKESAREKVPGARGGDEDSEAERSEADEGDEPEAQEADEPEAQEADEPEAQEADEPEPQEASGDADDEDERADETAGDEDTGDRSEERTGFASRIRERGKVY
jgi:gas vesicle structural protein